MPGIYCCDVLYECILTNTTCNVYQDVSKCILDKCTVSPPNCPDPGEIQYSVLFNYEFVEDFRDEHYDMLVHMASLLHVYITTIPVCLLVIMKSNQSVKRNSMRRRHMAVATWMFAGQKIRISLQRGVQLDSVKIIIHFKLWLYICCILLI